MGRSSLTFHWNSAIIPVVAGEGAFRKLHPDGQAQSPSGTCTSQPFLCGAMSVSGFQCVCFSTFLNPIHDDNRSWLTCTWRYMGLNFQPVRISSMVHVGWITRFVVSTCFRMSWQSHLHADLEICGIWQLHLDQSCMFLVLVDPFYC